MVDEHNHGLNIEAVAFREDKRFNNEMMDDIQFLTQHCKLGATTQRRYLEEQGGHLYFITILPIILPIIC